MPRPDPEALTGFVANRIRDGHGCRGPRRCGGRAFQPCGGGSDLAGPSFGFRLSALRSVPDLRCQAGAGVYCSIFADTPMTNRGGSSLSRSSLLKRQMEQGHLGLKTGLGFYEYSQGAAKAMKRERDRRLYARLRVSREEEKLERGVRVAKLRVAPMSRIVKFRYVHFH